jgi:HSP20 family molecular chaperone IbpA
MHATIIETIERVEQLYAALTGHRPPHLNGNGAAIPPESDPLVYVHDQLDRKVALASALIPATGPAWQPRVLAWRDDGGLSLAIDVPGVSRDQLQIRLDHATLTVEGHRLAPGASQVRSVDACDTQLGLFSRAFVLSAPVVPEQIAAHLADGVLTIRIDTSLRGPSSQIQIRS